MTKPVSALLLGLALGVAPAAAQEAGRFKVVPSFGIMRFDRTSALSSIETGLSTQLWPTAGLQALYGVRSGVRAGLYLDVTRPETSSDYYAYALLKTGNNYQLFGVSQRVVVLSYGVTATVDVPFARKIGPYLRGGIGRHSVFADVQRTNSTESITGTEFSLGGGLSYAVSEAIGLRLELSDFMWSNWDREDLDPVAPAVRNTTFPEDNPVGLLWGSRSLIHNLRLTLGFSFTPSGGSTR